MKNTSANASSIERQDRDRTAESRAVILHRTDHPDILLAWTTRRAGSIFPWAEEGSSEVGRNRERIWRALGLSAKRIIETEQVHGGEVAFATGADAGTVIPGADGLITETRGIWLLARAADCPIVCLWDHEGQAVAIAHSGWRGTLAGIAGVAAGELQRRFGICPSQLRAWIGPSIGPCCFEISGDIIASFAGRWRGSKRFVRRIGDRTLFDLTGLLIDQLQEVGLSRSAVELTSLCTRCRQDALFSHRGSAGNAGRFGVILGLQE